MGDGINDQVSASSSPAVSWRRRRHESRDRGVTRERNMCRSQFSYVRNLDHNAAECGPNQLRMQQQTQTPETMIHYSRFRLGRADHHTRIGHHSSPAHFRNRGRPTVGYHQGPVNFPHSETIQNREPQGPIQQRDFPWYGGNPSQTDNSERPAHWQNRSIHTPYLHNHVCQERFGTTQTFPNAALAANPEDQWWVPTACLGCFCPPTGAGTTDRLSVASRNRMCNQHPTSSSGINDTSQTPVAHFGPLPQIFPPRSFFLRPFGHGPGSLVGQSAPNTIFGRREAGRHSSPHSIDNAIVISDDEDMENPMLVQELCEDPAQRSTESRAMVAEYNLSREPANEELFGNLRRQDPQKVPGESTIAHRQGDTRHNTSTSLEDKNVLEPAQAVLPTTLANDRDNDRTSQLPLDKQSDASSTLDKVTLSNTTICCSLSLGQCGSYSPSRKSGQEDKTSCGVGNQLDQVVMKQNERMPELHSANTYTIPVTFNAKKSNAQTHNVDTRTDQTNHDLATHRDILIPLGVNGPLDLTDDPSSSLSKTECGHKRSSTSHRAQTDELKRKPDSNLETARESVSRETYDFTSLQCAESEPEEDRQGIDVMHVVVSSAPRAEGEVTQCAESTEATELYDRKTGTQKSSNDANFPKFAGSIFSKIDNAEPRRPMRKLQILDPEADKSALRPCEELDCMVLLEDLNQDSESRQASSDSHLNKQSSPCAETCRRNQSEATITQSRSLRKSSKVRFDNESQQDKSDTRKRNENEAPMFILRTNGSSTPTGTNGATDNEDGFVQCSRDLNSDHQKQQNLQNILATGTTAECPKVATIGKSQTSVLDVHSKSEKIARTPETLGESAITPPSDVSKKSCLPQTAEQIGLKDTTTCSKLDSTLCSMNINSMASCNKSSQPQVGPPKYQLVIDRMQQEGVQPSTLYMDRVEEWAEVVAQIEGWMNELKASLAVGGVADDKNLPESVCECWRKACFFTECLHAEMEVERMSLRPESTNKHFHIPEALKEKIGNCLAGHITKRFSELKTSIHGILITFQKLSHDNGYLIKEYNRTAKEEELTVRTPLLLLLNLRNRFSLYQQGKPLISSVTPGLLAGLYAEGMSIESRFLKWQSDRNSIIGKIDKTSKSSCNRTLIKNTPRPVSTLKAPSKECPSSNDKPSVLSEKNESRAHSLTETVSLSTTCSHMLNEKETNCLDVSAMKLSIEKLCRSARLISHKVGEAGRGILAMYNDRFLEWEKQERNLGRSFRRIDRELSAPTKNVHTSDCIPDRDCRDVAEICYTLEYLNAEIELERLCLKPDNLDNEWTFPPALASQIGIRHCTKFNVRYQTLHKDLKRTAKDYSRFVNDRNLFFRSYNRKPWTTIKVLIPHMICLTSAAQVTKILKAMDGTVPSPSLSPALYAVLSGREQSPSHASTPTRRRRETQQQSVQTLETMEDIELLNCSITRYDEAFVRLCGIDGLQLCRYFQKLISLWKARLMDIEERLETFRDTLKGSNSDDDTQNSSACRDLLETCHVIQSLYSQYVCAKLSQQSDNQTLQWRFSRTVCRIIGRNAAEDLAKQFDNVCTHMKRIGKDFYTFCCSYEELVYLYNKEVGSSSSVRLPMSLSEVSARIADMYSQGLISETALDQYQLPFVDAQADTARDATDQSPVNTHDVYSTSNANINLEEEDNGLVITIDDVQNESQEKDIDTFPSVKKTEFTSVPQHLTVGQLSGCRLAMISLEDTCQPVNESLNVTTTDGHKLSKNSTECNGGTAKPCQIATQSEENTALVDADDGPLIVSLSTLSQNRAPGWNCSSELKETATDVVVLNSDKADNSVTESVIHVDPLTKYVQHEIGGAKRNVENAPEQSSENQHDVSLYHVSADETCRFSNTNLVSPTQLPTSVCEPTDCGKPRTIENSGACKDAVVISPNTAPSELISESLEPSSENVCPCGCHGTPLSHLLEDTGPKIVVPEGIRFWLGVSNFMQHIKRLHRELLKVDDLLRSGDDSCQRTSCKFVIDLSSTLPQLRSQLYQLKEETSKQSLPDKFLSSEFSLREQGFCEDDLVDINVRRAHLSLAAVYEDMTRISKENKYVISTAFPHAEALRSQRGQLCPMYFSKRITNLLPSKSEFLRKRKRLDRTVEVIVKRACKAREESPTPLCSALEMLKRLRDSLESADFFLARRGGVAKFEAQAYSQSHVAGMFQMVSKCSHLLQDLDRYSVEQELDRIPQHLLAMLREVRGGHDSALGAAHALLKQYTQQLRAKWIRLSPGFKSLLREHCCF